MMSTSRTRAIPARGRMSRSFMTPCFPRIEMFSVTIPCDCDSLAASSLDHFARTSAARSVIRTQEFFGWIHLLRLWWQRRCPTRVRLHNVRCGCGDDTDDDVALCLLFAANAPFWELVRLHDHGVRRDGVSEQLGQGLPAPSRHLVSLTFRCCRRRSLSRRALADPSIPNLC
jgi:hypothetical protein